MSSEKFLEEVRKRLEERDLQRGHALLNRQEQKAPDGAGYNARVSNSASSSIPTPTLVQPVDERVETSAARNLLFSQRGQRAPYGNGGEERGSDVRAWSPVNSDLVAQSRPPTAVRPISRSLDNTVNKLPVVEVLEDDSDDEVIDLIDADADDNLSFEGTYAVGRSEPPRPSSSKPSCPVPSLFDDNEELDCVAPLQACAPQKAPTLQHTAYDIDDVDCIAPLQEAVARTTPHSTTGKREMQIEKKTEKAPKRQKVEKAPKEKRGAKFRGHPSRAVLERLTRASRHRLFLVDKKDEQGTIACAVMGSNGNIYKCHISVQPSCECPDFQTRKGTGTEGPCKHLIFVFTRVLKVPREDPTWWQIRLLSSELQKIVEEAPKGPLREAGVMAQDVVVEQYQQSSEAPDEEGRRPLEGECTICYEDLAAGDENQSPGEKTTYCKKCGNNFHSMCLQNWHRAQRNPTCPLCRQSMAVEGKGNGMNGEGFLNLAQYSAAHERQLTLAELYENSYQHIGRAGYRGRGARGRGRGRSRGRGRGRGPRPTCTG